MVYLGMPIRQDEMIHARVADHCADLLHKGVVSIYRRKPNNGQIAIARNALAYEAVLAGADFAMIDSDVLPPDDWIQRLYALNKDVACGLYPITIDGKLYWDIQLRNKEKIKADMVCLNGVFKVLYMGGSTCLIKNHVFKKLQWPWFFDGFKEPNEKGDMKIMTEDYCFSKRIRDAGFDIWCDSSILCSHFQGRLDLLDLCHTD